MRNRIRHRHDRFKPKHSLLITMHHSSLIRSFPAGILHIVETFTVCFPNVDFDAADGLVGGVFDCAEDEAGGAVGIVGDESAVGGGFGFVGVEGSEDGAFG